MADPRRPEPVQIPRWLPPVLYAAVTLFLFREFVFSSEMLFGSDTESLGYMARAFFAERLGQGDIPLWNPLILGGTPFLDSLAGGDSLYPPSLALLLALDPHRALGWKLVLHVFAAGVFAHLWARELGCSRAAALIAGLAFMAGPFFVTLVFPAHDGKMFVTALTPLLFLAVERWFSRRRTTALAGIGATVALVLLTTHFQMAYFLFGAVGAYAIVRTVGSPRPAAAFGLFLLASVLGAAAAGVQLIPAVKYVLDDSRRAATTTQASPEANRAYASSWSLHPEEALATLVVPEFVGSDIPDFSPQTATGRPHPGSWVDRTYWGRNPFKLNHEYVGLAALLLGLLAFTGPRAMRGRARFLGIAGGLALLYALGEHTPVWGLFYAVLPGIDLFRAPSMVVFLTGFAVATLAALGTDRVLGAGDAQVGDPAAAKAAGDEGARIGSGLLFGATALLALGTVLAATGALESLWATLVHDAAAAGRADRLATARPFITKGFAVASAIAGLTAVTVWGVQRGRLTAPVAVAVLALVVTVDAVRVDLPFVQTRDFDAWAASDPNVDHLLGVQRGQIEPLRVLDLNGGGQEVRLGMFGLELAGGHHPNDLGRYRTLIGMQGGGVPENLLAHPAFLRILATSHVVWPARQYGPLESQLDQLPGLAGATPESATQLPDGRYYEAVYRLPGALPRARLVGIAEVVADADVVARIAAADFDPAASAILSPEWAALAEGLPGSPVEGTVRWVERTPDRSVLEVESESEALLVLADNWFPSWRATVGAADVPIGRAYLTLRAVRVPAGTHTVVFEAGPGAPVRAGLLASGIGWLALALLALGGRLRRRPEGYPS